MGGDDNVADRGPRVVPGAAMLGRRAPKGLGGEDVIQGHDLAPTALVHGASFSHLPFRLTNSSNGEERASLVMI